jgi:hypothetical protein
MNTSTGTLAPLGQPLRTEAPKPANPEPTPAPADPEKHHTPDPEQGKSEHPKQ